MDTFTLELTGAEGQILYEYLKVYTYDGTSSWSNPKEWKSNARALRAKISKAMGQQLRQSPKDPY